MASDIDTVPASADALADRVLAAALGTADLLAIYLGDRLGWYDALVADGPLTADELAQRTSTDARYAREWLEQQAITGFVAHDAGRFWLDEAAAEVLTDRHSLAYLAPVARMFAASAAQLPALLGAYRTGGGVSWSQLGPDARESQADANRPWFEHALAPALAGVPELTHILSRPGARVVDVGCGAGWSTIALAKAFPTVGAVGIDIDEPTVAMARDNVTDAGLADRVAIQPGDALALPQGGFDAAFAFECIHDMPNPVDVLSSIRRALKPGGTLIVMDEAVAEEFAPPGGDLERLMYGYSILICLPDGMSHQPSAATGTVMRPSRLAQYAQKAGFQTSTVLPIKDFGFWRFYRLAW
jgi:2-polyprenyl-3-methyl-5-hydroxy-6-metoxy-1,4-benzoquinol methylase